MGLGCEFCVVYCAVCRTGKGTVALSVVCGCYVALYTVCRQEHEHYR